jgi:hypothetical protein
VPSPPAYDPEPPDGIDSLVAAPSLAGSANGAAFRFRSAFMLYIETDWPETILVTIIADIKIETAIEAISNMFIDVVLAIDNCLYSPARSLF